MAVSIMDTENETSLFLGSFGSDSMDESLDNQNASDNATSVGGVFPVSTVGVGVSLAVMEVVLIAGNLLTLFVIKRFRRKAVPDVLVAALVVCGLITGVFPIPVAIHSYLNTWNLTNNTSLCDFLGWISFASIAGSMFVLTLMAVDRYLTICRPIFYKTKVTAKKTLFVTTGGLLAICFFAAIPLMSSEHMRPYGTHAAYCHFDYGVTSAAAKTFSITVLIIGYFFVVVVLVSYVSAVCALRRFIANRNHMTRRVSVISEEIPGLVTSPGFHGNRGSPGSSEQSLKLEAQFTRMSWVLLMVYWITWTPLLGVVTAAQLGQQVGALVDFIAVRLAVLNSVVNPFILLCLYGPYRKGLRDIIYRVCSAFRKKRNLTPPSNPWNDRHRSSIPGTNSSRSTPTTPTLHHNNLGTPRRCLSMGDIISATRHERAESPPPVTLARAASTKSILANRPRPHGTIRKAQSVQWNERVTIAGEQPGKISIDTLKHHGRSRSIPRTKLEKYVPSDLDWSDSESCSTCSGSSYSDDCYSDEYWSDECCNSRGIDEQYEEKSHHRQHRRTKSLSQPQRVTTRDSFTSHRFSYSEYDDVRTRSHGDHSREDREVSSGNARANPRDTRIKSVSEESQRKDDVANGDPRKRTTSETAERTEDRKDKSRSNIQRRGRSRSAENIPIRIETCLYRHSGFRPCFRCRALYGRTYSGCKHIEEKLKSTTKSDVNDDSSVVENEVKTGEDRVMVRTIEGGNPQMYNLIFQHVMGSQKKKSHGREHSQISQEQLKEPPVKSSDTNNHNETREIFVENNDTDKECDAAGVVVVNRSSLARHGAIPKVRRTTQEKGKLSHNTDISTRKQTKMDQSKKIDNHRTNNPTFQRPAAVDFQREKWPGVICHNADSPTIRVAKNKAIVEKHVTTGHANNVQHHSESEFAAPSRDVVVSDLGLQRQLADTAPESIADSGMSDVPPEMYYPSSGNVSENEIPYNQYVRRIRSNKKENGNERTHSEKKISIKPDGKENEHFRRATMLDGNHQSVQKRSSISSGIGSSTEKTPSPRKQNKKRRSSRSPYDKSEGTKKDSSMCSNCGCHLKNKKPGKTPSASINKNESKSYSRHDCHGIIGDHPHQSPEHNYVEDYSFTHDSGSPEIRNSPRDLLRISPAIVYRSEVKIKLKNEPEDFSNERYNHGQKQMWQSLQERNLEGALAYDNANFEADVDDVFSSEETNTDMQTELKILNKYPPQIKTRRAHSKPGSTHERTICKPGGTHERKNSKLEGTHDNDKKGYDIPRQRRPVVLNMIMNTGVSEV
ncbi:uncharacterized protein LOC144350011 [Saccoglossus kowalevskii]